MKVRPTYLNVRLFSHLLVTHLIVNTPSGLHAVERSQGTVIKGHTEFSGLFVNKVCFTVFQSVRIISFGQRTIL